MMAAKNETKKQDLEGLGVKLKLMYNCKEIIFKTLRFSEK